MSEDDKPVVIPSDVGLVHEDSDVRDSATRGSPSATDPRQLVAMMLLNLPVTFAFGLPFLGKLPDGAGLGSWMSALLAWLSNAAMLNLIVGLLVVPLILVPRARKITRVVVPTLFSLLNILVVTDYYLLKFTNLHLGATSLQLVSTPGLGDSVALGLGTIVTTPVLVLVCIGLTLGAARLGKKLWSALLGQRARRASLWMCVAVLLIMAVDKALFAWADVTDYVPYTRVNGMFPLYQPFTVKRTLRKLGVDIRPNAPSMRVGASSMNLPRNPLEFSPGAPRPNVILVTIEGLRYDMLTPEVMPYLDAWSRDRIVGLNHYSGGNASRFGIFSMLYGIYGTYWKSVLAERHPPPMLEAMAERGYAFSILSCVDLDFPEFRRTAFVQLADAITDEWPGERVERDERMTDGFLSFLTDRDPAQPFFSFLFYDASHQGYIFPPEHEVFAVPEGSEGINYILDVGAGGMEVLRRRYQNSLHYIDTQLQRVFDALEDYLLLDETLVIIAGDHGEEFGELGYFGHNTSFDRYQTRTVMVAHLPGHPPERIERLTSHMDFVPTILEALGVVNPVSDYSLGLPLTNDMPQPFTVVVSYSTAAIVETDAVTEFGTEFHRPGFIVRDQDYRIVAEGRAAVRLKKPLIMQMVEGQRQFAK